MVHHTEVSQYNLEMKKILYWKRRENSRTNPLFQGQQRQFKDNSRVSWTDHKILGFPGYVSLNTQHRLVSID